MASFLFPASASADIMYSRTPSGSSISNPVSFDVNLGAFYPNCQPADGDRYWSFRVQATSSNFYYAEEYVASTTLNYIFVFDDLPLQDYYAVQYGCSVDGITYKPGGNLETGNPAFTIVEAETPPASVFTLPADFNSGLTAVASDLVNNSWEIIALIIGIPLAFVVINKIKKLVLDNLNEGKNWYTSGGFEKDKYITEADKKYYRKKLKDKK